MLEPDDEILIPPTLPRDDGRRLRLRHAVRALAALLILGSVAYFLFCLKLDKAAKTVQQQRDLLGAVPGIVFGICLWWYAGRSSIGLHQPLLRKPGDAPGMGLPRKLLLFAGMVAGFLGLAAVTYGATIRLHGEDLRKVFWANSEKLRNVLWVPEDSPFWGLVSIESGIALILIAGVALFLASRRPAR